MWTDKLGLGVLDSIEQAVDVKDFYLSAEWDLIAVPAIKTVVIYPCCELPYPDITFNLTFRRKTLFYTVNLIMPCLSINMLTCVTLYLPSASGEKMSLCITILLSLSMFQMLLLELVPPTSLKIPLLGMYILFTMVIVSLSVLVSVITLNVNFRSTATHKMHNCIRKLFFEILPPLLLMHKPQWYKETDENEESYWSERNNAESNLTLYDNDAHLNDESRHMRSQMDADMEDPYSNPYTLQSTFIGTDLLLQDLNMSAFCQACARQQAEHRIRDPPQTQRALEGMQFIEKHHQEDNDSNMIKNEWTYMALVIDRILLWSYVSICTVGGASILLNAPVLYSSNKPIA